MDPEDRAAPPRVVIETQLGDIVLELDDERAPLSTRNFLRYVDDKRYASGSFYRTVRPGNQPRNDVKIEVIQGGLGYAASGLRHPPIDHETTRETGLRHQDGALSMARIEPGSASSEIFICIGDQPELDFGGRRNPDGQGFAAFGRVVEGMDVVRRIHQRPANGQILVPPIEFLAARRLTVN